MEKKETYLYVLLLPHMDKEYNLSYKVKFGYTENLDSRMKNGYLAYYGEEGCQILHIYKGDFTKEIDEAAIKQYLKEYLLFGDEWFKCCKEVLEFFNTYDTSEKLKQKISEIPINNKKSIEVYKVSTRLIDCVYIEIFSDLPFVEKINRCEKLEKIIKHYTPINQLEYIKSVYGLDESVISNHANILVIELAEQFINLKSKEDRLKFIVSLENKNLTSFDLIDFFLLIPNKYNNYYDFLGFEGIKNFNYNETKIKERVKYLRECKDLEFKKEMLKSFKVGDFYLVTEVKNIIDNICRFLKYNNFEPTEIDTLRKYYKIEERTDPYKKCWIKILQRNEE
jgi:hypothetical protein